MNFINKLFFLFFMAFICFVISCNSNAVSDSKTDYLSFQEDGSTSYTFDSIGIIHNDMVSLIVDNICNGVLENNIPAITSFVKTNLPQNYKYAIANIDTIQTHIIGSPNGSDIYFDWLFAEFPTLSPMLQGYLNDLADVVSNSVNLDHVNELIEDIERIEALSISNLDQNEKIILLSTTSVGKASSKLWFPENKGGEGKMRCLIDSYYDIDTEVGYRCLDIGWAELVLADMWGTATAGVSSVVFSGGLTAIPNPLLGGVPTAGAAAVTGGILSSSGAAGMNYLFNENNSSSSNPCDDVGIGGGDWDEGGFFDDCDGCSVDDWNWCWDC